jgi:hypothetical protein
MAAGNIGVVRAVGPGSRVCILGTTCSAVPEQASDFRTSGAFGNLNLAIQEPAKLVYRLRGRRQVMVLTAWAH